MTSIHNSADRLFSKTISYASACSLDGKFPRLCNPRPANNGSARVAATETLFGVNSLFPGSAIVVDLLSGLRPGPLRDDKLKRGSVGASE